MNSLTQSGIDLICNESENDLFFAEEDELTSQNEVRWKIMIVDDEADVHSVTRLVLKDFTFLGKGLTIVSAYSGAEAKQLIAEHPDTAIMLLDVIMETESIGLEVVKYIRETLNNKALRIILRTGQPGQVPEKHVILDYDINDYKTKTDLTDEKLFTTLVVALRAYDTLHQLEQANTKLFHANNELADSQHNLELKVKERTKQLQSKNEQLELALKEVNAAQQMIIAQEKLAYLGMLTAGVAHEIRNPLNFTINLARLIGELCEELLDRVKQPVVNVREIEQIAIEVSSHSKEMELYGSRANSVIQNMLLHASHKGSLIKQLCNLNSLIDEALRLVYPSVRNRYKGFSAVINTDYDAKIGEIEIVPQDMSRALINILDNACYALYEKKSVSDAVYSPKLEVRTHRLDEGVEITIWDNGCGMPAHIIDRIFNPFFTTKSPGEGTGLGLFYANDIIVSKHQGTIHVKTEQGEFTEFKIQLPIK